MNSSTGTGNPSTGQADSPELVHHCLEHSARRTPDADFLIQEGDVASYGDVEAGANRIAHALIAEGISPGDRVALLAQNSRFYVEAYYGILKAGGVAVPLNTAAGAPAIAAFTRRSGARALIAGPRQAKVCVEAAAAGDGLELLLLADGESAPPEPSVRCLPLEELRANASSERPDIDLPRSAVASIIFTSGSTGTPQGATLSHTNICANTRSIVHYLELEPSDRILALLPFYYVYGKSLLNTHAAVGGCVVIENRFLYPNVALDTLERERCTGLSGVPSTFAILLNRSNLAERELESLRYVTQAGGAMSPALTRRLIETLPRQSIFVMYGATEASARLAYLPPADLPRKIGSIGRSIPDVELTVRRPDGTECDIGEVGEIVARGPNIMLSYWEDPEATAEVLDELGYHTGDLARRDDEGFLFIEGRRSDFIKSGAHRVSAKEIEENILEVPEIHEAAVVGLADEILGEKICAFVVLRDGCALGQRELLKLLKRGLPAYKLPSEIRIVADLPKNESGKILKRQLVSSSPDEGTS